MGNEPSVVITRPLEWQNRAPPRMIDDLRGIPQTTKDRAAFVFLRLCVCLYQQSALAFLQDRCSSAKHLRFPAFYVDFQKARIRNLVLKGIQRTHVLARIVAKKPGINPQAIGVVYIIGTCSDAD